MHCAGTKTADQTRAIELRSSSSPTKLPTANPARRRRWGGLSAPPPNPPRVEECRTCRESGIERVERIRRSPPQRGGATALQRVVTEHIESGGAVSVSERATACLTSAVSPPRARALQVPQALQPAAEHDGPMPVRAWRSVTGPATPSRRRRRAPHVLAAHNRPDTRHHTEEQTAEAAPAH